MPITVGYESSGLGGLFALAEKAGQAKALRERDELTLRQRAIDQAAAEAMARNQLGYAQLAAASDNHFADREAHAAAQSAALSQQAERDMFLADEQRYRDEHHVDLQARLNEVQLTQNERLRMQRMRNAIADVRADPSLSPDERNDLILSLQTGVSPLYRRQREAAEIANRLHEVQLQQATAQANLTRDMMAPGRYDPESGISTVDLGNGQRARFLFDGHRWIQVRDPEGDPGVPTPREIRDTTNRVRAEMSREIHDAATEYYRWRSAQPRDRRQEDIDSDPSRPPGMPMWAAAEIGGISTLTQFERAEAARRGMTPQQYAHEREFRRRMNERLMDQGFPSLDDMAARRFFRQQGGMAGPSHGDTAGAVGGFGMAAGQASQAPPAMGSPEDRARALAELIQGVAAVPPAPRPLARGLSDEERALRQDQERQMMIDAFIQVNNLPRNNESVRRMAGGAVDQMNEQQRQNLRYRARIGQSFAPRTTRSAVGDLGAEQAQPEMERIDTSDLGQHPGENQRSLSQSASLIDLIDRELSSAQQASAEDRARMRTLRGMAASYRTSPILDRNTRNILSHVVDVISDPELRRRLSRILDQGRQ